MPIFYQFRPLEREALRERLLSLSQRAGVPVLGAFEWGLGGKRRPARTPRSSASGGRRRILVSDTLLKDYSDDEIEVILAHEIAHHVHHDTGTALALETCVVAAAVLTPPISSPLECRVLRPPIAPALPADDPGGGSRSRCCSRRSATRGRGTTSAAPIGSHWR